MIVATIILVLIIGLVTKMVIDVQKSKKKNETLKESQQFLQGLVFVFGVVITELDYFLGGSFREKPNSSSFVLTSITGFSFNFVF